MSGQFSEESILNAVYLGGGNFAGLFEFARCQRPDGSFYGTKGKCRKGKQAGKKQQNSSRVGSNTKEKPKKETRAATGSKTPRDLRKEAISLGGNEDAKVIEKKKKEILDRVTRAGVKGKQLKDLEKHWNRMLSAVEENKKFASRLSQTLPKSFKTSYSTDNGVEMTAKLKSGDIVKAVFSPSEGFHFTINGETDAGSIKDRKNQIRAAFTVRTAFRAVVAALPEGSVIRTGAHTGDGKGAERVRAYTRMGFSSPETIGDPMFAVVGPGGSVVPASNTDYKKMRSKPGTLWFSESSTEDVKLWIQAIFGLNHF